MTFLAILAALALERALHAAELQYLRAAGWFSAYQQTLRGLLGRVPGGNGVLGVAVVCLLPAVAVWLLVWLLAQVSVVLAFLASVLVLLYCLGPTELLTQLRDYVSAHQDQADGQETDRTASAEITRDLLEAEPAPTEGDDSHRAVTETALVRANDRLFAVLFWFAVLGPAGAGLYRCARLNHLAARRESSDSAFANAASMLEGLLAWLPARILAITYALTGSFEESLADWKAYYEECSEPFYETSEGVLSCAGCGALRISAGGSDAGLAVVRGARSLLKRSLLLWLVLLAVLTLVGLT